MSLNNVPILSIHQPSDWSPGVSEIGSLYSMYCSMSLHQMSVLCMAEPSDWSPGTSEIGSLCLKYRAKSFAKV